MVKNQIYLFFISFFEKLKQFHFNENYYGNIIFKFKNFNINFRKN